MNTLVNGRMRTSLQRYATILGALALVATSLVPSFANAAQITARKVTLGSSSPASGAATTAYTFNFTLPTTTALKSVEIQACTTAISTCTTPTGFVGTGATLTSQPTGLGAAAGWTTVSTAGALRLVNAANATASSGAVTLVYGNVQNPTTANTSFYLRITTYTGADYVTGALDTGVVGASTTQLIVVSADVAESLTFTTGTSGANCAAIAATSALVALTPNPLSTGSTSTGTSLLCAGTNAASGYNIQYLASPFTSGAATFANGYTVGGSAAALGTEEFGLKATYTSGGSGGAAAAPYNTANYAWNPSVATSLITGTVGPSAESLYTVTYSANVALLTKSGTYSSTLNYIATAQF